MNDVQVHPIGRYVKIGLECDTLHPIKAVIIGIKLTPDVQYLCAWYSGRDRKEIWIEAFEVLEVFDADTKQVKIGFK